MLIFAVIFMAIITSLLFISWKSVRKRYRKLLFIALIVVGILLTLRGGPAFGSIIGGVFLIFTLLERISRLLANQHLLDKILEILRKVYGNTQNRHDMSEEEAREVLAVSANSSKEEIRKNYHKLMEKNHPDKGGSKYIAAKLNQARDTLLR